MESGDAAPGWDGRVSLAFCVVVGDDADDTEVF
jgi:hypothetical protein